MVKNLDNGLMLYQLMLSFPLRMDAPLLEQGLGTDLVFNGQTSRQNGLGFATEHVYCGNVKPDIYYGQSSEVYLKFRSKWLEQRGGFQLQVALNSNRERHYDGLQGRVHLSQSADCNIIIRAPPNYTLSLYYTELIFGTYDCEMENLEVFDRTNRSLQRVCSFVDMGKSLFSNANELHLVGVGFAVHVYS
ncbi:cubilin homolog isoform X2 [Drosophila simulans]|uniref:GD10714 n=1 Tax=Drosophila simulans TaxID=7240 RepID=B4QI90_DROSI|nr:cubilin homolog isoform X2 [Drosophila simulans]EDX06450.1 GD10714 [Drosophila simulans]